MQLSKNEKTLHEAKYIFSNFDDAGYNRDYQSFEPMQGGR